MEWSFGWHSLQRSLASVAAMTAMARLARL
jgi:hypothetical protein